MKKVVLAYSGGLDTSVILKWLIEKGYEVVAFIADVGQAEDFEAARQKALKIGALEVQVQDLKEEFVVHYIFQALKGNAIYEGRYLLGTALARPLIAKAQIDAARKADAQFVAHGATGKGNDQVRFELAYCALAPEITVLAPWKDDEFLKRFSGRSDLIAYAEKHGIPVKATASKPYSEDDNLMHISHEAGILEDPSAAAGPEVYSKTRSPQEAPDKPAMLRLTFADGLPVKAENLDDGTVKTKPLELFTYLNGIGGENGVGRVDMVENRFVGIKSRGVYETPGAHILWAAHRDLEGVAMDKEVMHLRDMLTPKFSELIYNGFWFSPEMDFLLSAINRSQELIDGTVTLQLYKGNVMPVARSSPTSLYSQELSSMDIAGGFDQRDSRGFIRINGLRLGAHKAIVDKRGLGRYKVEE